MRRTRTRASDRKEGVGDSSPPECERRRLLAVDSPASVAMLDNSVWSPYGAQRAQPVTISAKSTGPENRGNKRKPLPPVATRCLRGSMARRGRRFKAQYEPGTRVLTPSRHRLPPWQLARLPIDLLRRTGRVGPFGFKPPVFARLELWNRGGATAGKRSALRPGESGLICDERLRPVATGCRLDRMVRRGSTVRVRQRASRSPCKRDHFSL